MTMQSLDPFAHAYDAPVHARLDMRLPVAMGLAVLAGFAVCTAFASMQMTVATGIAGSGVLLQDAGAVTVAHSRGGLVSHIKVREGDHVQAGEVLVSFDTRRIDEQIAALKAQAEAASRQIELIRLETATAADLAARKLASRERVEGLETKLAVVKKEAADIAARIATATRDLELSAVRAPHSGRVTNVRVVSPRASVEAGGAVLDLAPDADIYTIETDVEAADAQSLTQGMPANIWLGGKAWHTGQALTGRVTWIADTTHRDPASGASRVALRVALSGDGAILASRSRPAPGAKARVLVITGQQSLFDKITAPLARLIRTAKAHDAEVERTL